MRATVKKTNPMLRYCDAISENHLLFIFRPPPSGLNAGDVIEFDEEILSEPQAANNLTTGATFPFELFPHNIHDLCARNADRPVPPPTPNQASAA